jgi:hypothetical protein
LAVQRSKATVQLCNHRIQCRLGNGWIATVAVELVLVLFDVLENIGFEIGSAATSMISNMVTNA